MPGTTPEATRKSAGTCSAERGRDRHGAEVRTIRLSDVGEMEQESRGNAEQPKAPRRRQRQVDFARQCIREVVEGQRRVVGGHSCLLAPQPEDDEVFVVRGRVVDETVDSPGECASPSCPRGM